MIGGNHRSAHFVGRRRELLAAQELLQALQRGEGHALVLSGPAGIGKTTLLAEIVAMAKAQGLTIRFVQGSPAETSLPYSSLQTLLRPDGPVLSDGELRQAVGLGDASLPPTGGSPSRHRSPPRPPLVVDSRIANAGRRR